MMSSQSEKKLWLAYILWGFGFFGLFGIHRFYLGKPITGILWFFSGGIFFIGHLIDFFLIPSMVNEFNTKEPMRLPIGNTFPLAEMGQQVLNKLDLLDRSLQQTLVKTPPKLPSAMHQILESAAANGKVLSLAQAMMATGLQANEVQELLNQALRNGIAHVDNDPESGAVRYYFDI